MPESTTDFYKRSTAFDNKLRRVCSSSATGRRDESRPPDTILAAGYG